MKGPDLARLAVVVQRCHPTIVGGSEALAWQYARLLSAAYRVDVVTTSTTDVLTWKNDLDPGVEERDGVRLLRFRVSGGRSEAWRAIHALMLRAPENLPRWPTALQEEFVRKQGPRSDDLLAHLRAHREAYRAVLFVTYLYPTTYDGTFEIPRERALLVATLHDEPPAHLEVFRRMARRVRGVLWNAEEEAKLGARLWGDLPGRVVSMAVDTTLRTPSPSKSPYLLYSGRISTGKGSDTLLAHFAEIKRRHPSDLKLLLTGPTEMPLPAHPDVAYRGIVEEEEKFRLMAGAKLFVMSSSYESLSIATLEAMGQSVPVLADRRSAVVADHVARSGGGALYDDYASFEAGVLGTLADPEGSARKGKAARAYVLDRYAPDRIRANLLEAVEGLDRVEP